MLREMEGKEGRNCKPFIWEVLWEVGGFMGGSRGKKNCPHQNPVLGSNVDNSVHNFIYIFKGLLGFSNH